MDRLDCTMCHTGLIRGGKLLLILLALILSCSSCRDGLADGRRGGSEPQETVLTFKQGGMETYTRAALKESEEKEIKDVEVLVFDSKGEKLRMYSFDGTRGQSVPGENEDIRIGIPSSEPVTVYVLLNAGDKTGNRTGEEDKNLKTLIEGVTTEKELESLNYRISANSVFMSEGAFFMMGKKTVDLSDRTGIENGKVTVEVRRILAKIEFDITWQPEEQSGGYTIRRNAVLKEWKVSEVPSRAKLKEEDAPGTDFFTQEGLPFEDPGNTFTFYMLPNTPSPVRGSVGSYKERELQEKVPLSGPEGYVRNGKFANAPEHATYVTFTADYSETKADKTGAVVEHTTATDNRYTVHLGCVDNDLNNWEAGRNCHYVYRVLIKGVDEIVTEVVKFDDPEPNPGVEGNVRRTRNEILADAPFSTALIRINRNDVGEVSFMTETPFSHGEKKDAGWVHFKKNTGQATSLMPFKGISDPELLDVHALQQKLKDPSFYDSDGSVTLSVYIDEFYYTQKPDGVRFDGDWETQGWTTFVNCPDRSFTLTLDSKGREKPALSKDRQSSFIRSDISIRQKSIFTPYTESYAKEKKPVFGIEVIENEPLNMQKDNASLFGYRECMKTWDGLYDFYTSLSGYMGFAANTNYNWDDYLEIEKDRYVVKHTGVWNTDPRAQMPAQLGCLTMNRDENGNGKIDKEEVKWYLPSIDEYVLLGIAEPAVPQAYRLSIPSPIDRFKHYVSSTQAGDYRLNKMDYYAELSLVTSEQVHDPVTAGSGRTGSQSRDYDYVSAKGTGQYGSRKIYYRCARLLGATEAHRKELNPATKPYKYSGSGKEGDPYTVTLDLADEVFRPQTTPLHGELPEHNQLSVFSRPVRRFYVAKEVCDINGRKSFRYDEVLRLKPCGRYRENAGGDDGGWRLPNARELSVMVHALAGKEETSLAFYEKYNLGWKNVANAEYNRDGSGMPENMLYWSSTYFEGANSSFYLYGVTKGINIPTVSLFRTSNVSGFVRCVKDKTE